MLSEVRVRYHLDMFIIKAIDRTLIRHWKGQHTYSLHFMENTDPLVAVRN